MAALPAAAISIQYSGGYGTGSGAFTGVANLGGCSGALLADGVHVLTAAHCVGNISAGPGGQTIITSKGLSQISFFTGTYPSGVSDAITAVHFNPAAELWFPTDPYWNLLMYDLAVIDLAAPAPADATRYEIDSSGYAIANHSAVTLAGWGLGGYPTGSVNGTGGTRRAGTNTVAGVLTSMDDPLQPGDPVVQLLDEPIDLEWTTTSDINDSSNTLGLGNSGDSGGPLLYDGKLIGVLSFGSVPRGGTIPLGYTFDNGYENLANAGNVQWLGSLGLIDVNNAPEPGTWILAIAGLTLLRLSRRIRA